MNAMSSSSPGSSYTPPPPAAGPPTGDRQLMLVLSYLGILALIPLIMRGQQDREIRWHAINGLALCVAYIIVAFLWAILNNFMPAEVGCALSFVGCGIFIAYLAVAIFGIMKALKGQRLRIPLISDIADR